MRKHGHEVMMLPAMIADNPRLEDEEIKRELRASFAPHRCVVRFQRDAFVNGRKIALLIQVHIGSKAEEKEFQVEGVPIDLLRDSRALSEPCRNTSTTYADSCSNVGSRFPRSAARPNDDS